MKEININIEGYNVNGICVGCLNYNRRMFYDPSVKECFLLLGNIDVPDGLEIQVCWECLGRVKSAIKFKEQILKSFDFLMKYSRKHTFLDNPNEFIAHASVQIERTDIECFDCVQVADASEDDEDKDLGVKEEEDTEDNFAFKVAVKEENFDHSYFQDLPAVVDDLTSDEDVELSRLKEKDSEKIKKKRKSEKKEGEGDRVESPKRQNIKKEKIPEKKNRKLMNLPEELVELYTMSKDEMWALRIDDVTSKEFQKLKHRCDDCIIGFNTEKLMLDHLNGKHQPKSEDCEQCSVCQAYFVTKENVAAHKSLHLQGYRCKECGFNTTLKRRMLKHVTSHALSGGTHVCSACGASFGTKSKLAYHRGVCLEERPQCDCCGKVFANKMTLKYHLKILPQNKDNKPKEKLYIPCKGCDKVFHSKKSYRAHVVIHDGVTYPCPICGKLFQWKRNLARHKRNHVEREQGNLHECRACGKTFASRECFNNHMRLSKKHVSQDTYQ